MSAAETAPVVQVRQLVRRFTQKGVLNGIDLDLAPGQFLALLGRSGSGKSTLLRAIADLDHEAQGSGTLTVPDRLSVVFQDARLLPWMSLIDNVVLGLGTPDARQRGLAVLAEVGLEGREDALPQDLSGGEQQRVAFARALVREPQLLLADEPFGALDALTRLRMHALVKRLSALHGPAILLVTHDVDEAIALADRIVVLEAGQIVADVPVALPAEPQARLQRFAALRQELLGWLGVTDAAPGAPPFQHAHHG